VAQISRQNPKEEAMNEENSTMDNADEDAEMPAKSALKEEWVDHAVSQGAKREEAEDMTKAELQNEYGEAAQQRTDASGRVLNPWESSPKVSKDSAEQ
jgi:hypothetical protein